jgi:bifunctional non-homologous end joining protein LigD
MLPHLRNRPLALHRYPDGIGQSGFVQQKASGHFPDWIRTQRTPRAEEDGEAVEHVLCNDPATLVYLANQAVVSLHGWLSRSPRIRRPDRLVFDLDPADEDFGAVRQAARWVIGLMTQLGMNPHVMTTGSRGLHVVAPLRPDTDFDAARRLAVDMAKRLARQHPEQLTTEMRKSKRAGRIYLDVMRNAYGQTTVAPYSVRALPGAPVATPLDTEELADARLQPRRWHLRNVLRRLGQKDDPWARIGRHATALSTARRALRALDG